MLRRLRNYWRRWGLHKARADAQMWEELCREQDEEIRRLAALGERYVLDAAVPDLSGRDQR